MGGIGRRIGGGGKGRGRGEEGKAREAEVGWGRVTYQIRHGRCTASCSPL